MASPSGNLLAGRYRTLKRLGAGGMATVLLAEDTRLGREVAVKRMHAESPEEAAKRFRREAQLGASLNHPNIVSVFDIETDPENVLIVMEYVPGGTLKDALARGPLPRDEGLKLLRGIAAALDYAHEHDVVHRDVKPANILLDADGRAKLADLGIATAAEVTSITSTGAVLGTASYMPPERLDGHPGGKEADIYALATVAYETLTGQKARQGRSAVEVAAMVMSEPPPDLRVHAPDAPEAAAAVLARGMARDPADRPGTACELIEELGRAFEEAEAAPEPEPTAAIVDPDTAGAAIDHTPRSVPQPTYRRHRAERRPAAAPVPGRPSGSSDRRWLLPVAALIAALIAVGLILALAGGDDSPEQSGDGDVQGESARGSDTDGGGESGSGGGQTDPGAGGSAPGGGAAGGGGSAAGGAGGAGGADSAPAKAVQDFYTLAAKDDFEAAWELAGPGVRQQLGGYDTFVNTLQSLERIEFPQLQTTVQSGDRATVQLQSVATHTDRVDRCSGSAELTGGGDTWKIERLNVDCNQGTSGGSAPPQVTPGKGPAGGKPKKEKQAK